MMRAPDAPNLGKLMTNFDGSVDETIATALKDGGVADYPAWNFHGTVWFADGLYHCEVWQYHRLIDVLSAETPAELMTACSDAYGHA